MLNVNNMKNAVMALLPSGSHLPWLEEYFVVAFIFMFFNVAFHIIAFRFDAKGQPKRQQLVDDFAFFVLTTFFPLFVTIRLQARGCRENAVNNTVLVALIVISPCSSQPPPGRFCT